MTAVEVQLAEVKEELGRKFASLKVNVEKGELQYKKCEILQVNVQYFVILTFKSFFLLIT
jgi:hypothetical protein